jgi:riboflavin kinase/FMN adenylyltransferase
MALAHKAGLLPAGWNVDMRQGCFLMILSLAGLPMRIFRHFHSVPGDFRGAVLAMGDFDGVHLGHRALIAQAKSQARAAGCKLAVMTFEPHPREFFGKESGRLTPLRAKARLLAELGVDVLFALRFDDAMARRSAPQFVQDVLLKGLRVSGLVMGEDFVFGEGRGGDFVGLAHAGEVEGFSVTAAPPISDGKDRISASRIRDALCEARPDEAARLLGRGWAVEGRVRHGDARGRTLSFPTANMLLGECVLPARGIYAVRVKLLEKGAVTLRRNGVANFGIRPMYRAATPLLETHLFDFDGDLYGKNLCVELVAWLRPEANFQGAAELIAQMNRDAEQARGILSGVT